MSYKISLSITVFTKNESKRMCFRKLLSLLVILNFGCAPVSAPVDGQPVHHTSEGFTNPHLDKEVKSVFSYMKMRWFSDEEFADQTQELGQIPVIETTINLKQTGEKPRLTWLGHSTFLIQYRGVNILTDPILSSRASPVSFAGPVRLAPKPYDLDSLPKIDIVIISHNHYDHLDSETVSRLGNTPQYLVPLKLASWFMDAGIQAERVHEFDWWDAKSFGPVKYTATPSQHWSGRGLFDRYETLWAAWHLDFGDFTLWCGGDTGYNSHQFKAIGQHWGGVDVALIPIGAYAPRWFMKASHVNPDEAVRIHNDIRSKFSIGMHWATFQLTAESLAEPRQRLKRLVAEEALARGDFITLAIGESITQPKFQEVERE